MVIQLAKDDEMSRELNRMRAKYYGHHDATTSESDLSQSLSPPSAPTSELSLTPSCTLRSQRPRGSRIQVNEEEDLEGPMPHSDADTSHVGPGPSNPPQDMCTVSGTY